MDTADSFSPTFNDCMKKIFFTNRIGGAEASLPLPVCLCWRSIVDIYHACEHN